MNKDMDSYRKIFIKSLYITLRNKYLWIFGLLSSLLFTFDVSELILKGIKNYSSQGYSWVLNKQIFLNLNIIVESALTSIKNNSTVVIVSLLVSLFIFSIVILLLSVAIISQVIVFNKLNGIVYNKSFSLADGFKKGLNLFWRLVLLHLIIFVSSFIATLLFGIPSILLSVYNLDHPLIYFISIIAFIILMFFYFFIAVIQLLSSIDISVNQSRIKACLYNSMLLFKKYWLVFIESAILLSIIKFLFFLTLIIIGVIIFVPLYFASSLLYSIFTITLSKIVFYLFITGVIFTLIISFMVIAMFQLTFWYLIYVSVKNNILKSKIIRLAYNLWGNGDLQ
jgi:hypothetical protein